MDKLGILNVAAFWVAQREGARNKFIGNERRFLAMMWFEKMQLKRI